MFRRTALAGLLCIPLLLEAMELKCASQEPEREWLNDVREIVVNPDSGKVAIRYKREREFSAVSLISQEGGYFFNMPTSTKNEFNAYKLFSVGREWRVIDAGLTNVNGVPVLRALGPSTVLQCSWHDAK